MLKRTIAGIIAAGAITTGVAGAAQAQSAPDDNMSNISQEQRKDFFKKVSDTWMHLKSEGKLKSPDTLSFVTLQALAEKTSAYDATAKTEKEGGIGVFKLSPDLVKEELGDIVDGDGDGKADLTNVRDSIATALTISEKRTAELDKETKGALPGKPEMVNGVSTKESVTKNQEHQLEAFLSGVAKAKTGEVSNDTKEVVKLGEAIHKSLGSPN